MLEWLRFILAAALLAAGLVFIVSSVVGVNRFRYALNRMHAAALGDTLGLLLTVLGLAVISGFNMTTLKLLLLVPLWWLTSPVASHLLSRLQVSTEPKLEEHMAVLSEGDAHEEVDA